MQWSSLRLDARIVVRPRVVITFAEPLTRQQLLEAVPQRASRSLRQSVKKAAVVAAAFQGNVVAR
jgi:hypothetical protein